MLQIIHGILATHQVCNDSPLLVTIVATDHPRNYGDMSVMIDHSWSLALLQIVPKSVMIKYSELFEFLQLIPKSVMIDQSWSHSLLQIIHGFLATNHVCNH